MALLFVCAQWHALAKLRLHNDFTLDLLDYTTVHLGSQMRLFQHACSKIPTKELKKEAEARARKATKKKNGGSESASPRPAGLKIFTIKFHFLGDYVPIIRQLGTTDSYSTQTVCIAVLGPYNCSHCISFSGRTVSPGAKVMVPTD